MSTIPTARPRRRALASLALAAALVTGSAGLASADGGSGGDRSAAGGAFMSSYSQSPYPRGPQAAPFSAPAFEPFATGSVDRPSATPTRPMRRGARWR